MVGSAAVALYLWGVPGRGAPPGPETIRVDQSAPTRPFPHFWEQMFGSGRAILSLRESYREDLRATRRITGFRYVRFHGILDDEVGVYSTDAQGRPVYNFSYLDEIFDGLLANGVRPFVELSFMPAALAASQTPHAFWYRPLPNPPADYGRWGELVYQVAHHAIERYGAAEVRQWYFEVWNEPNIDFWTGQPRQATYFQLYDAAANGVKRADAKLRVGGPATAQAAWVPELIAHCHQEHVPLDFVSTHVYGNDTAENVFGTDEKIPRSDMVARAVRRVHDQVAASALPELPIHWSEYNASYMPEPGVEDAPFMGPWLANNIRQCDGLTTTMSYWAFSDVFEEQGVVKAPFYGGYGVIAAGHIPKASFNAFALLHDLGTERIAIASHSALATRKPDGTLAIAVWNYWPPEEPGEPREFQIEVKGLPPDRTASVRIVDAGHGSPVALWKRMGSPSWPSREQRRRLIHAGALPAAETRTLTSGALTLTLAPHALALLEIRATNGGR
jgi:xylan 1,4-beta-xylosidase